jgi:tRNA pseudouridine38-40 synthase
MRNIKLILEYDGTEFSGWQRQRGARTVQGVVEEAVRAVFAQECEVIGAGRTDAGVHALEYPCNFHAESELTTTRIAAALAAHLPEDVAVKGAYEAAPDFHAQFDALSRRYAYQLETRPTAIHRRTRYTPRAAIDPESMARAAHYLLGEHDFTSFTPAANEAQPVCRVIAADVRADGSLVTVTVEANRFLHHMVRVIVGTLVEVGRGRWKPERVEAILCKKDRREAGPTAPPRGLALVDVSYAPSSLDVPGAD